MKLASESEIDERFKAMPGHPGLRHFRNGISKVEQWTGKETKEMQKVFGGILPGAVPERVVKAAHALLDFIYHAQFQAHTDTSLDAMQAALDTFHANKDVFITLGTRKHFNIPKLHSMQHYLAMIKSHGALDGYNTETSERLHIDFAKHAYRASNKRDYVKQMAMWLQRQEAVFRFGLFLGWMGRLPAEVEVVDGADKDDEDEDDRNLEDLEDAGAVKHFHSGPNGTVSLYHLAKVAPYPNMTVAHLIDTYDVPQFIPALRTYFESHHIAGTPSDRDRFPVYTQLTVRLPHHDAIDDKKRLNRIWATPAIPATTGFNGRLAHFDTALIKTSTGDENPATAGTGLHGTLTVQNFTTA